MVPPVAFMIFLVVIALVIVGGRRYLQRIAAGWTHAARELGLRYETRGFGRPRLSGVIESMSVEVDVQTRKSGDSNQSYTRYRVDFPSQGVEFRLTRQTGLSRITKFFGAKDVEVGDAAFDAAFVVKTENREGLRGLLEPGLRGLLVRNAAAYPGIEFRDHGVLYESPRLEPSRDVIVSTVRRLVDTAAALSGTRLHRRSAEVVAARERGELHEAARGLPETEARRGTLDERIVEMDTLATAGRREAARRRLEELEKEVPADPDVTGWKQRLEQPAKAPAAPAGPGPDARTFAEAVFSGSALSFESTRIFDEDYRGVPIRWRARVKSVDSIRRDSELGPEGAVKLVATIATIDHDLYGNTDIDAVVGLPPGTGGGLERGRKVTISGTMTRVDPLVRNVFISDGALG